MSEEEVEVQEQAPVSAPREVLTWKQKAIKLYEGRQLAREQQQKANFQKMVDQFRENLAQLLGKEYEEIDDMRVEIEGVIFVGTTPSGPGATMELMVEFKCPDCGHPQTQIVRGLADIGSIISGGGEPHEDCPAKKKAQAQARELTAAEKLIEAFRDFLASELEQVEE